MAPGEGYTTAEEHIWFDKVRFYPDPSGRHGYRGIVDDEWSELVIKGPMSLRARSDPEGQQLLRDAPVPIHDTGEDEPDLVLPDGGTQWRYRVISATFGADLERTLNRYGAAGWEVVSISAASGFMTLTGNKIFALVKRPRPKPEAGG
jgi:hypothetical protein